jgi:transcriptional regulator with XRE-family HTH domain
MDTGLRLKLFRVSAGLKQRDIASALGVTPDFVSMIDRGK